MGRTSREGWRSAALPPPCSILLLEVLTWAEILQEAAGDVESLMDAIVARPGAELVEHEPVPHARRSGRRRISWNRATTERFERITEASEGTIHPPPILLHRAGIFMAAPVRREVLLVSVSSGQNNGSFLVFSAAPRVTCGVSPHKWNIVVMASSPWPPPARSWCWVVVCRWRRWRRPATACCGRFG